MSLQQHFLQSKHWQAFRRSRGIATIRRSGDGWEYLALLEPSTFLTRLYCPYGPTVRDEQALSDAITDLRAQAKHRRAGVLRIQPIGVTLDQVRAVAPTVRPIEYSQPTSTWLLDLSPSLDDLYAGMKQNTRNICRNYAKKGLSYRQSTDPADMTELVRLLKQVAQHNQIAIHNDGYFSAQAEVLLGDDSARLHFIDYKGTVIAAALTYQANGVVYYAHAAADHQHRPLGASTALLGELIVWAKHEGYHTFDFFGIAPTDEDDHPQAGLTRFKQSFGGYRYDYLPTMEIPLKRLRYGLYTLARRLYRIRR